VHILAVEIIIAIITITSATPVLLITITITIIAITKVTIAKNYQQHNQLQTPQLRNR
jgi:hypothetical protein